MDGATNNYSGPSATNITGDRQTSPEQIETDSRLLFSSDYYRKVDRTTDIAGRLPNAVYTLPPCLVQAIVGRAGVDVEARKALFVVCRKFFVANRQCGENRVTFADSVAGGRTTIALDCGRLYAEGDNSAGQCGIGSQEDEVTGPRLIRLPPVLRVWHYDGRWFANTTRGLYAWGWSHEGSLGLGDDHVFRQPRRVPIAGDLLEVCLAFGASFFRTDSGWFGCGLNSQGQLGLGHIEEVIMPMLIPGSEGVTRWEGCVTFTFGFTDGDVLAAGLDISGQCGVGRVASTDYKITTLTPVALPDDVKGRVDRVVFQDCSTFFIAGRRCFACGDNEYGQLGLRSDESTIRTPTELPIPVDDIITCCYVVLFRSGDTLLACGSNEFRLVSFDAMPQFYVPILLDLPGPVVKIAVEWSNIFVQLTDGSWVGRGEYDSDYFAPVPEADLVGGQFLRAWTPVTDVFGTAREVSNSNVLVLAEPIANNR